MYGVDVGDLGGADHVGNVQIALGTAWRPYADGLVGKAHVQRITIGFRINRNGGDIQFLAGADHTQSDLTAISDQYFAEHGGRPEPTSSLQHGWRIALAHIRRAAHSRSGPARVRRSRPLQFRSSISWLR